MCAKKTTHTVGSGTTIADRCDPPGATTATTVSKEIAGRRTVVLTELAELVVPRRRLGVLSDKPDNRILECAEAGEADCIVTGDKAMLKLGADEHVRIISLRQYLDR